MAELYTLLVDGKPVAYAYGEEWVAMGLYTDDIKFKTPEEAKAWWEEKPRPFIEVPFIPPDTDVQSWWKENFNVDNACEVKP